MLCSCSLLYFHMIHPQEKWFFEVRKQKGKAIKQKLSLYYFLLDNIPKSWTSPHGPINPFLRPHFTHNKNFHHTFLNWAVRKVCSGSKGRDVTSHLDGVVQGSLRLCGTWNIVGVIFIKYKFAIVFLCKMGEGDNQKAEVKRRTGMIHWTWKCSLDRSF